MRPVFLNPAVATVVSVYGSLLLYNNLGKCIGSDGVKFVQQLEHYCVRDQTSVDNTLVF